MHFEYGDRRTDGWKEKNGKEANKKVESVHEGNYTCNGSKIRKVDKLGK